MATLHAPVRNTNVTTYTFKAVVEQDDDRWHAYSPTFVDRGGATWGDTREEALENLEEVLKMVVLSLIEHGEPILTEQSRDAVGVSENPLVVVNV